MKTPKINKFELQFIVFCFVSGDTDYNCTQQILIVQ